MKQLFLSIVVIITTNVFSQTISNSFLINGSINSFQYENNFHLKISKQIKISLATEIGYYGSINNLNFDIPYVGKYLPANYKNEHEQLDSFLSNNYGGGLGFKVENSWRTSKSKKNKVFIGCSILYYLFKDYYTLYFKNYENGFKQKREEELKIQHSSIPIGLFFGFRHLINKKIQLESKINLPFYFPIKSNYYKLFDSRYKTIGLEPTLSLGINYIIKK